MVDRVACTIACVTGPSHSKRILVAGMGNVLRRDDGFGVEVARLLLATEDLPLGVTIVEAGISGVRVVQELLDGYDGLIFVDATVRGDPPGTLFELEPSPVSEIPDPANAPTSLHMLDPRPVMVLARAAGCLPPRVSIIGCEPADFDELQLELSPPVAAALPHAVALVLARVRAWQDENNS
jgi:hydrogenase maturation protease